MASSSSPTNPSSAAFEQFCLLAKSQRGRALVALIEQVLVKEKIYVFGELLAMDAVQVSDFGRNIQRYEQINSMFSCDFLYKNAVVGATRDRIRTAPSPVGGICVWYLRRVRDIAVYGPFLARP